ncbi:hypothetical protein [Mycolicibacterium hodleri]|uniref:hypothetical protein n=1 Tax=Mycolicibacterium hodleri TaxID=49897 RepID=UPI0013759819|nr:hypothetical protein [Mycolicibacterium hodleri]
MLAEFHLCADVCEPEPHSARSSRGRHAAAALTLGVPLVTRNADDSTGSASNDGGINVHYRLMAARYQPLLAAPEKRSRSACSGRLWGNGLAGRECPLALAQCSGQRLREASMKVVDQAMHFIEVPTQLGLLASVALLSSR